MRVSVVIPVGPFPSNVLWLPEALESVLNQTLYPDEIIVIDDGAGLDLTEYEDTYVWHAPWRMGISHSFNVGVGLSRSECVFMLGSDDTLEPTCLEKCMESYSYRKEQPGYYSVPIRYMDDLSIQTAPCNAAMVTRSFWRMTGGFPIESAVGVGDSMLLSICLKHKLPVYWVGHDVGQDDTPLYNYRRHPDIHTYKLGPYWGAIDSLRNTVTELWTPPEWTKNY